MSSSINNQTGILGLAFVAVCASGSPCAAQETVSGQQGDHHAGSADDGVGPNEGHDERYTQLVLDGSFAASGVSETGTGGGAALRAGQVFPVGFVVFVPELGADVFKFAGHREATVYGGFAGARMRFGRLVEPGVFAHVGVAGVDRVKQYAAPSVDFGIAVDITYFDRLLLGVQGEYKSAIGVGGDPSFSWYTAGASVGLKL